MNRSSQSVDSCAPDGHSGSMVSLNENGLILRPVAHSESGQGLPYAPEDWPNPGDIWRWRAGTRTQSCGFIRDRYLYLPSHLRKSLSGKKTFASKTSVTEFIQKEFPNADIDAFFSSFSWKILSSHSPSDKDDITSSSTNFEVNKGSGDGLRVGDKDCKVGNEMCSCQLRSKSYSLPDMDCDICCSEPGFCRDCCCILCCKTIDWAHEGYSFIRCEATQDGSFICGHIAHIDCALHSYMAGTVGSSIGLDVEYYCRRCDKRTDLILHVTRILKLCQSLDSMDEIEKILKLGLRILHGSKKVSAKGLLLHIQSALKKLRSGVCLKHIWNLEENSVNFAGNSRHSGNDGTLSGKEGIITDQDGMDFTSHCELNGTQQKPVQPVCITSDRIEPSKLDEEIKRVLLDLKNSQEIECRIAKENLHTQKEFLLGLYQQLKTEKSKLANRTSATTDCTKNLTNMLDKVTQIKRENHKLADMKEVAKGFGRVPKDLLKELFGLQGED